MGLLDTIRQRFSASPNHLAQLQNIGAGLKADEERALAKELRDLASGKTLRGGLIAQLGKSDNNTRDFAILRRINQLASASDGRIGAGAHRALSGLIARMDQGQRPRIGRLLNEYSDHLVRKLVPNRQARTIIGKPVAGIDALSAFEKYFLANPVNVHGSAGNSYSTMVGQALGSGDTEVSALLGETTSMLRVYCDHEARRLLGEVQERFVVPIKDSGIDSGILDEGSQIGGTLDNDFEELSARVSWIEASREDSVSSQPQEVQPLRSQLHEPLLGAKPSPNPFTAFIQRVGTGLARWFRGLFG